MVAIAQTQLPVPPSTRPNLTTMSSIPTQTSSFLTAKPLAKMKAFHTRQIQPVPNTLKCRHFLPQPPVEQALKHKDILKA